MENEDVIPAYLSVSCFIVQSSNFDNMIGQSPDVGLGPVHYRTTRKATRSMDTFILLENDDFKIPRWQPHLEIGNTLRLHGIMTFHTVL